MPKPKRLRDVTGGTAGPEASLLMAVGFVMIIAVIRFALRRQVPA